MVGRPAWIPGPIGSNSGELTGVVAVVDKDLTAAARAPQQGDQGGREVILAHPEQVASVGFESEEPQRDVDTWDDYLAARARLGEA